MIYFAYGSNMNWDRMRERCSSARFLFPAKLNGFRLDFTRYSNTNRCGSADLLVESFSTVWGVVYHIKDEQQSALDRAEGVAAGAYKPFTVNVHPDDERSQRIKALTFVVVTKAEPRPKPSPAYKQLILDGALHWRLPDEYVQQLRAIETQP